MLVTISTNAVVRRLCTRVDWTVLPLVFPIVVLFPLNKISSWEIVPVLSRPRDLSSAVFIFNYGIRFAVYLSP